MLEHGQVKACGDGPCEVKSDCEDGEWGDWQGPPFQFCAGSVLAKEP